MESVDSILSEHVELESVSPALPLKNLDWGNVWFDEFYDEKRYGDVTFAMAPEKLFLLWNLSLTYSGKNSIYFTDGTESIEVSKGDFNIQTLESIQNLNYPIFALDKSNCWFLELNYEGSNFFANQELIKDVVANLGGNEKIYSEMLNSLNEYEDLREISDNEYQYLKNIKIHLEKLAK